jgi:uncharacterized membrane protein YfcA
VIEPLVVAFWLEVGMLIGLTGVGGGSLMTPLLILVVGMRPLVAIPALVGLLAVVMHRPRRPEAGPA